MSISEKLTGKILSEIPSQSLRDEIAQRDWKFTDEELFLIAAKFCALYKRRQKLLKEIVKEADERTATWAERYVAYENKKLAQFAAPSKDAVYLARIKEKACRGTADYVFKSFIKFRDFCKIYDGKILKVKVEKILYGDTLDAENDYGYLGSCELDGRGRVLEVSIDGRHCEWGKCKGTSCEDCKNLPEPDSCRTDNKDVVFPAFFRDYDIVKFSDYNGDAVYGFALNDDADRLECAYIINLNETAERYALGLPLGFKRDKKYFSTDLEAVMFQAHDHVYPPLLEKIEYKRLPARLKRVYDKLTADYKQRLAEGGPKK